MRMAIGTAVVCLTLIGLSHAADVEAAVKWHTDIPAQGLAPALRSLAKDRGFQIVFASKEVSDLHTQGAVGEFTTIEALAKILTGTGLTYRYLDDNTITIAPLSSNSAKMGPEVTRGENTASPSGEKAQRDRPLPTSGKSEAATKRESGAKPKSFWQRLKLAQADSTSGNQTGNPPSDRQDDSQELKLEEIIVTAQKREESLEDVPISISVLTGDQLDSARFQGVAEALSTVAGVALYTDNFTGGTNITIRGVAPGGAVFGGSSTVSYYLDGVPFGLKSTAIAPDAEAYDLERVEVLRGPQGTLYGASALNGVVRVLTKDADLNDLEFKARSSVSYTDSGSGNYRADMAVNVPLIPGKLAVRGVVGYQDLSGWIDKINDKEFNDGSVENYRLKIGAQPTDRMSIELGAWRSRSEFGGSSMSLEDPHVNINPLAEPRTSDYDTYNAMVTYKLDKLTISSSTSYMDSVIASDFDLTNFGIEDILFSAFNGNFFAEELNLTSTLGGPWQWSLGAFYRDADDHLIQTIPAIDSFEDSAGISKSYAVFGELTRSFGDGRFDVTAGLRYFEDKLTDYDYALPEDEQKTGEATFKKTTPRAVLTWHAKDNLALYGSYSQGYRSGAMNGPFIAAIHPDFARVDADTLTNYELGIKGSSSDHRTNYEAALYYIDWDDVQQNIGIIVDGVNRNGLVNGESAGGVGFDFSVGSWLTEGLHVAAALSWNDLTASDDILSGGALLFPKGSRLNSSAKSTASVSADYTFRFGSAGFQGFLSASLNHLGKLRSRSVSSGVVTGGLSDNLLISRISLAVESPKKTWTTTLFVDNATNEDGTTLVVASYPNPYNRLRPRTAGLQLEYRY